MDKLCGVSVCQVFDKGLEGIRNVQSCRLHPQLLTRQTPPSSDYVPGLEHPPSPDYVPGPEEPEQAPPLPPLPMNASPTALSPGYVANSDLEEDLEEDHADYPADEGDDDDSFDDDEEE
ncbi:hypothetical protein Tco_0140260 [Tanacetum coccineum]